MSTLANHTSQFLYNLLSLIITNTDRENLPIILISLQQYEKELYKRNKISVETTNSVFISDVLSSGNFRIHLSLTINASPAKNSVSFTRLECNPVLNFIDRELKHRSLPFRLISVEVRHGVDIQKKDIELLSLEGFEFLKCKCYFFTSKDPETGKVILFIYLYSFNYTHTILYIYLLFVL